MFIFHEKNSKENLVMSKALKVDFGFVYLNCANILLVLVLVRLPGNAFVTHLNYALRSSSM